jgi:hypothetical protein
MRTALLGLPLLYSSAHSKTWRRCYDLKETFRRYEKLCWLCKVEYNIVEACTLFEICTATLANGVNYIV